MGWFKKRGKKEGEEYFIEAPSPGENPELPKLQEMPKLPRLAELPKLPSMSEYMATAAPIITPETSFHPSGFISPPQFTQSRKQGFQTTQTGPVVSPAPKSPPVNHFSESEPIFVKIDKFKEAVSSFEQVKQKVADIEAMLKEIKGLKNKESAELNQWESEIQAIKSRIANIDDSLFKKLNR